MAQKQDIKLTTRHKRKPSSLCSLSRRSRCCCFACEQAKRTLRRPELNGQQSREEPAKRRKLNGFEWLDTAQLGVPPDSGGSCSPPPLFRLIKKKKKRNIILQIDKNKTHFLLVLFLARAKRFARLRNFCLIRLRLDQRSGSRARGSPAGERVA